LVRIKHYKYKLFRSKFEEIIQTAISKKQVIESIQTMPEEAFTDIDVLLERIMLSNKTEAVEKNITEGKIYSTDEAKEKLSKRILNNN